MNTENIDLEKMLVLDILNKHKEKNFVQRILEPDKFPKLDVGGGQHATHRMAWGEIDGKDGKKYVVFPTVRFRYPEGRLTDLGERGFAEALKDNEYIEFDSPNEADWFSKKYKRAWE